MKRVEYILDCGVLFDFQPESRHANMNRSYRVGMRWWRFCGQSALLSWGVEKKPMRAEYHARLQVERCQGRMAQL